MALHIYMWQSRVENLHYSIFMKIEFKAENIAIGPCLYESRVLAPQYAHAMRYGALNTTPLMVLPRAIFAMSAKSNCQRSNRGAVRVLERRFLASFRASWTKNYGDSSVRGIKASNNQKLRSYPSMLPVYCLSAR